MSRIVIIGGSGHIGSYLVPRLVSLGHQVVNVSRGSARPYRPHHVWTVVEQVMIDREAEDKAGTFGARIAELGADIVVDMIAFDLASTRQVVEAIRGKVQHYIFCSTIWVYGGLTTVPSTETEPVSPIDSYGRARPKASSG